MSRINEEIIIQGKYDLAATVTRYPSDKKQPAVLVIGGTGKLNRDGNGLGFKINVYKDLAESMTDMGYVSLRYDKRGVAKSGGDAKVTGVFDMVDDVLSCIKYLKSLPYVDENRIILAGHSEGCILSTLVSKKESVAGLLLISGAGVCLRTSMEEQAYSLLNEVKETRGLKGLLLRVAIKEKAVIGKQKKLFKRILVSTTDSIRVQMAKFPAKWMREHLKLNDEDFINILSEFQLPVLAVTGDKDIQTDYRNLDNIRELGMNNIQVDVIDDMDHILKRFDGKMTILNIKKQYLKEKNNPIHRDLIELIKSWSSTNILES